MTDYILGDESNNNLTAEDGDELLLFNSSASMAYRLEIDWNGDGAYDADSEGFYMVGFASDRGRDTVIEPAGGGFTPYDIGKLYIALDNSTRRFDPWNTSSPLYGYIEPGKKIQLSVNIFSVLGFTRYYIFTGYISDIQMEGRRDTITLVCDDYWSVLSDNTYLKTPENHNYLDVYLNVIMTASGFPGDDEIATAGASQGFTRSVWADNISYKTEIENVVNSILGRCFINGSGKFYYYYIGSTDSAALTITDDMILKDVYLPVPWEVKRNKIRLSVGDRIYGLSAESGNRIYSLPNEYLIKGSDSLKLLTRYKTTDNESRYCEVSGYHYTAFSSTGGGGSNVTSDLSVSVTHYIDRSDFTIANSSSDDCYLYTFYVDGYWTTEQKTVYEYSASTSANRLFYLDTPYLNFTKYCTTDGITKNFESSSDYPYQYTTLDIDRINDVGNTLLNYLSTARAYPTIQMQGRYSNQFDLELEDKITLNLTSIGITGDYRIHKISHEASGNCQDVLTTFKLYPAMTLST